MHNPAEPLSLTIPTRLRLPFLPPMAVVGFVTAVIAVAVMALFSYNSLQDTDDLRSRVSQGVQVVDALQTFLGKLVDAETGRRGFLMRSSPGPISCRSGPTIRPSATARRAFFRAAGAWRG